VPHQKLLKKAKMRIGVAGEGGGKNASLGHLINVLETL